MEEGNKHRNFWDRFANILIDDPEDPYNSLIEKLRLVAFTELGIVRRVKPEDLPFEPCDKNCPALTLIPSGSARYCPMKEPERHKSWEPELGTGHPNYTDCCANFQCCDWPEEFTGIRDALIEGANIVHVHVNKQEDHASSSGSKKEYRGQIGEA